MKDIAAEAREEAKEASEPGARGKEYRDKERMGDEGQAYKHGGGIHGAHHGRKGPKHHSLHRERGGYMPEETEGSEKERGKHQMGHEEPHEDEPKGAAEGEANEKYPDVNMKRGGENKKKRAHKRRKGGILPLDGGKEHMTNELQHFHHQARKAGGLVRGGETKERPDRRARGGATSDLRPETAAGKMSLPDYLRQHELPRKKGHGTDNANARRGG
jgi:hypothetical protein